MKVKTSHLEHKIIWPTKYCQDEMFIFNNFVSMQEQGDAWHRINRKFTYMLTQVQQSTQFILCCARTTENKLNHNANL